MPLPYLLSRHMLLRDEENFVMQSQELRAKQAPLKERYKADPSAALVTLRASGRLTTDDVIGVVLDRPNHTTTAGLHPVLGGSGEELCSGDMLLEALIACAGTTMRSVSIAMDIVLDTAIVEAEGDVDFRGTFGVSKDAPIGFIAMRMKFTVKTDAPDDKLATLLKLTERYCLIADTLRRGTPLTSTIERA
jgi:uncharacterized OsmC-like protein